LSTANAYAAASIQRNEPACGPDAGKIDCSACTLACPKAGGHSSARLDNHAVDFGGVDFLVGGAGNDLLFGQPASVG
jgi:hypothetical protein